MGMKSGLGRTGNYLFSHNASEWNGVGCVEIYVKDTCLNVVKVLHYCITSQDQLIFYNIYIIFMERMHQKSL